MRGESGKYIEAVESSEEAEIRGEDQKKRKKSAKHLSSSSGNDSAKAAIEVERCEGVDSIGVRCGKCQRDFCNPIALSWHVVAVHLKESPLGCSICWEEFKSHKSVSEHLAKEHEGVEGARKIFHYKTTYAEVVEQYLTKVASEEGASTSTKVASEEGASTSTKDTAEEECTTPSIKKESPD